MKWFIHETDNQMYNLLKPIKLIYNREGFAMFKYPVTGVMVESGFTKEGINSLINSALGLTP